MPGYVCIIDKFAYIIQALISTANVQARVATLGSPSNPDFSRCLWHTGNSIQIPWVKFYVPLDNTS